MSKKWTYASALYTQQAQSELGSNARLEYGVLLQRIDSSRELKPDTNSGLLTNSGGKDCGTIVHECIKSDTSSRLTGSKKRYIYPKCSQSLQTKRKRVMNDKQYD